MRATGTTHPNGLEMDFNPTRLKTLELESIIYKDEVLLSLLFKLIKYGGTIEIHTDGEVGYYVMGNERNEEDQE